MVAIYTSPHLLLSKVSIGIEKDFFHKTAFSYAISTCSSPTSLQAGRVLQQMLESGLMHWQKGFQCLKDSFILQMQDILIARNFLFLFGVFGIIFRSGVLQVFGMCLIQGLYYFLNNPTVQQMQRNYSIFVMLRHAMLLNVFLVFSSNASGFSFFLLTIHLTFSLVFLLLCVLFRILSKKLIKMKVHYPQIHIKQLIQSFLLLVMMTMTVVLSWRMMMKEIQRLSYAE